MVTLLLVTTCSYPVFLVALAFGPASSRLQQQGNVLWLSVRHQPPAIHPTSSSLQQWGGGARVLLGVGLSLGRGSLCRCCPLVRPVPAIVSRSLPGPRHCHPRVLAGVVPMSSPLSPCVPGPFILVPISVVSSCPGPGFSAIVIVLLPPLGRHQQLRLVHKKVR